MCKLEELYTLRLKLALAPKASEGEYARNEHDIKMMQTQCQIGSMQAKINQTKQELSDMYEGYISELDFNENYKEPEA